MPRGEGSDLQSERLILHSVCEVGSAYTQDEKKEQEGPLASTFPSTVYAPGNDKHAHIQKGKQQMMRMTACPSLKLIRNSFPIIFHCKI